VRRSMGLSRATPESGGRILKTQNREPGPQDFASKRNERLLTRLDENATVNERERVIGRIVGRYVMPARQIQSLQ
jgi:hypothetical protein